MKAYEKKVKAIEAINFLKLHPAFCFETENPICSGFCFSVQEVCRNGYNKHAKDGITVYKGDKHWDRFKHLVKEDATDSEWDSSVEVPYEDVFGVPWSGFRVKFWWDLSFYVWEGPVIQKSTFLEKYNAVNWHCCSGPTGESKSFEGMVIDAANAVKKTYGDFGLDDFLTPEEKKNHEEQNSHDFTEETGILENPQYIYVDETKINLRWLKWFMETDYAKKQWDFNFGKWGKLIENNL